MNNDQSIKFDDLETSADAPKAKTKAKTKAKPQTRAHNVPSFLPQAFADVSERKGYKGDLARYIACWITSDVDIDEAIAMAAIDCNGQGQEAPFNVIAVIGFYQDLMDKVCWNARRLFVANNLASAQTNETGGIYGVDFAQRAIDSTGVNADNATIYDIVNADYAQLFLAQSELLAVMDVNMDIDLLFFNPSERNEDGSWSNPYQCDSFDTALEAMNGICDRLKANEKVDQLAKLKALRDARLKERLSA